MHNAMQDQTQDGMYSMQSGMRSPFTQTAYFLVGVGIGAVAGVFLAPKSGVETRRFLAQKAEEGNEYAQRKAREMRDRAKDLVNQGRQSVEELVDRGKRTVSRQRNSVWDAIDGGKETYREEMSQAQ
jgi:gas vesicle protein